jgi:hypothetical protein
MELKLDGDAINKYMSEKMLDSALGEQMKIAVNAAFKELLDKNVGSGWDRLTLVQSVVNQYMRELIREYLDGEFKPIAVAMIKEKMANNSLWVDKLIQKMIDGIS